MTERKKRSDAGKKRIVIRDEEGEIVKKPDDETFTFKVNPADPIEGPVYLKLMAEKDKRNLRKFIVDAVAKHSPSPVSREAALEGLYEQAREHFDNLSNELNLAIDRLLTLQLTAAPVEKGKPVSDSTSGVNLDFLRNIQATLKKK
jgi:hypothetical protein